MPIASDHPLHASDEPVIVGMLHIPPLPGSPGNSQPLEAIQSFVLRDAEAWLEAGVRLLMLENFGDTPFFPSAVPPATTAQVTAIASAVTSQLQEAVLGINVLRNDGCAALSVAHAVGAAFIRVNVLCGARLTDQGIVHGIAHDLLRLRSQLQGEDIAVLADVDVKHSSPLAERPLEAEVADLIHRGHADGLIVSGDGTGLPTNSEHVQQVSDAAGQTPIFVGSGVSAANASELSRTASGLIVGTAAKKEGDVSAPVDAVRVREIVAATHQ